jgi:hypothetical protein
MEGVMRPPARRGHTGLRPGGNAEGTEKMNIERPTSNFEWEKMKKQRKVERKKLGRWENEKVGEKQD